ncbi:MAG: hypothetical protein K8R54_14400 [Bacteroidales bacterium]|nr:hypothetical protein [Bacteroidales bacterium]
MQNLVKYYNACFQADNNSLIVNNFFGTSVENRLIFTEEELINNNLAYYPVDQEYAEKTEKIAELYKKEKEFVYCSLFILGKTVSFNNRLTKICSPLVIHPAKFIKEDDIHYIQINHSERRINFSLLNRIREDDSDNEIFFEQIYRVITGFNIDETTIFGLSDIFKTFIPDLNIDDLLLFPKLFNETKIKKLLQPVELNQLEGYKIIPTSGAGIIKRSVNTRGIINELNETAKIGQFSNPMKAVFDSKKYPKKKEEKPGRIPAILSNPQKKVLKNAPLFPISLIIGPPGTGKSFTIASLAVEQMSKGKSVLIASKTDQAVDVIADIIENSLGIKNVLIRGGNKQYLKELKQFLQNILIGVKNYEEDMNSKDIEKDLVLLDKNINHLEKKFQKRIKFEMKRGKYLAENINKKGLFVSLKKMYIARKNKTTEPLAKLISILQNDLNILNLKTKQFISAKHSENINNALKFNRNNLKNLSKALRARRGTRQEEYFKHADFRYILKIFPIWLVKMSDIHRILPLEFDLFDIAVIDEATQCDIANSIPIIQRAKHVVLTGDPNQLRHVSFLSQARTDNLISKYELENYGKDITDYRHNSILDVVNNSISEQEQIFFLNEHYRSYPSIIRFSNKKFYSGALKIMKARPDTAFNAGTEVIKCNGQRNKTGYNKEEAEQIIQKISEILKDQEELDELKCSSVGILSPFRNQAEYISDIIRKTFDLNQINKHKIRASTAYGFQGDERDIMFLSFVLDNDSHPTAFRHINNPHVFNVSITRAKNLQYIYHSLDTGKITINSILREYIESFRYDKTDILHPVKDVFAEEIAEELKLLNIKTWLGYTVAGLKIDIMVKVKDIIYGIDLIGYPGEFEDAFTLERYKMLQRAGLKTIPVTYTRWISNQQQCFDELIQNLNI